MRFLVSLACAVTCAVTAFQAAAQPYAGYERESRYVTVRDGTRLAVNIYRPADDGAAVSGPLPVIFAFTPYRARYRDKDGAIREIALTDRLAMRSLIRAGYVVAVADVRGKGASFGHRFGFQSRQEAEDGRDLIEWLAAQPFSSGKIGMVGCSYLGGTTFQTTVLAPPSLRASFIGASDIDKYGFVANGGITAQFNTRPDEPLSDDLASLPVDGDVSGVLLRQAVAQHADNTSMSGRWYSMPYRDSVSSLTGTAFWQDVAVYDRVDAIGRAGIATFFWGNWHDEPTAQVLLAAKNVPGSQLLVGPGDHCDPPPGSDFTGRLVRYFDHHLKGAPYAAADAARATYMVEGQGGTGAWIRSDRLPGEDSQMQGFYLGGGGRNATLQARPFPDSTRSFVTDYDVGDPAYFSFWVEPMGDHGLEWTGAPLALPLKLAGAPVAHLSVRASTSDAPVFVYLERISPDGNARVISFGRLAISHRKESEPPFDTMGQPWHSGLKADVAPLAPGQTARLAIAMTPVGQVVDAGDRLRFVVTGADPRQRNLDAMRQDPPPEITVLEGGAQGSRIMLPVVQGKVAQ